MKRLIYLIPMIFTASLSQGQKVTVISKKEVIEKVELNNSTLKISNFNTKSVEGEYNQTKAVFLPTIGLSYTGISTTNPLMAFGSKLNQGILTQNDFNPDLLNNPSETTNFTTRIDVSQPLVNLDALHQRKAAKAKLDATVLENDLTKDKVLLEAKQSYMLLQLAYKMVEVLKSTQSTLKESVELAKNNLEQGYIQKVDLMLVEIRMTEVSNQLFMAESKLKNISNHISSLMGESTSTILVPSDSLSLQQAILTNLSLPINRADILARYYAQLATEQMYKSSKMRFMPRLNAFGSYELNDEKAFGFNTGGYLVGAKLSWNLFEGNTRFGAIQVSKAQMNKSKVEYEQYLTQSELELSKSERSYEDSKRNLATANLILEQTKEALRIRVNRFEQGVEKTTDLLLAEAQYAEAQLNQAKSIYQHNVLLNYLEFLTNGK